ncbi:uncharacterized protein [Amphiura filiformis]|uniref:uncharacterized protein n=1 Tax=Amphiura filiformis TaxID=82378 RepID=UPI003B2149E0
MSDAESLLSPQVEISKPVENSTRMTKQPKAKLSPFVAQRAKRHRPVGALTDNDEFMAAAIGDTAWLKQTLKTGKDPSQYDKNGLAALHLASLHGRLDCLKLLIEKYNVDVDLPSTTGWRAVHLAINNRTGKRALQCLQYLLDQGANASLVNDDELTPAHQAAIEGSVNGLQALINAGAKINIPDSKGHLPIDYAKLWGHRKCARILASESWRQDKTTHLAELQKLEELKLLKHEDDLDKEEVTLAEKEFFGQVSFTNWLDDKGLDKKSTGPTSYSDCSRHEDEAYIPTTESISTKRSTYQPNSVARKQPKAVPDEQYNLLKPPPQRTPRTRNTQPTQANSKTVKFEETSPTHTQSSKKGRKTQTPSIRTSAPDESLSTMRLDSAPMPNLPQDIIDRDLFEKPSPHDRPLNFKCKNIIDAQHRRLYPDDCKPLEEMYAHISDSSNSSLFPGNTAVLLQSVSSSSKSSRSSSADHIDYARIVRTIKHVSKPKVFPSLVGKDYTYGFEVL